MRNIYIYLLICFFLISACSDTLHLVPLSQKAESGFYHTSEHITQAINGCYDGLQSARVNSQFSYMLSESRSDNTWQGTGYDDGDFSRFSEDATNPTLATAWNSLYDYIQRCNKVLLAIPNVEEEELVKNNWKGEALFIRSLLYFDLVRIFGGVPIVTTPLTIEESYNTPKGTIEDVYDLIKEDLNEIVQNQLLPTEIIPGRANLYSAMTLLGKVLVYRSGYPLKSNEWSEAKDVLGQVIQSGQFEFFDNYEDIFAYENENGRQSVFSLKFVDGTDEGNRFPTRNAPNQIDPSDFIFGGSPYRLIIEENIADQIFKEEGDLRREASLRTSWLNKAGVMLTQDPWCHKYSEYREEINGPVSGAYNWNIDFIVLRYTDVLMLYAEAINESEGPTEEAMSILNQVRERAGLNPRPQTDQETFRMWLAQERRSEFCFENQRWFDLVRTDRALEVMQDFLEQQGGTFVNNFTDRSKYYFPIPQIVSDLTGIK